MWPENGRLTRILLKTKLLSRTITLIYLNIQTSNAQGFSRKDKLINQDRYSTSGKQTIEYIVLRLSSHTKKIQEKNRN